MNRFADVHEALEVKTVVARRRREHQLPRLGPGQDHGAQRQTDPGYLFG
ncbi:MAG: hypothetical protein ACREXU_04345 [Gammaproteobacteria bacterium]